MPRTLALVAAALTAGCSLLGIRSGYEQPRFEVLASLRDQLEVRRYGARLVAETTVEAVDEETARNDAFRILSASPGPRGPGETLAVLRFSGRAAPRVVDERQTLLLRQIAGAAWRTDGDPIALFHDPSWALPFLRRNEVAVPVVEQRPP